VDISMLDTQISLLNYMATMHLLSGEIPGPLGNAHFVHVPYDTYPTSDGWIIIAVIKDDFWKGVIEVTGLAELDTPEHERQAGRLADRDLIDGRLRAVLLQQPSAYWLEKLRAARVPCAPVNNFAQALTQPQVQQRGMVVEVFSLNIQEVSLHKCVKLEKRYKPSSIIQRSTMIRQERLNGIRDA